MLQDTPIRLRQLCQPSLVLCLVQQVLTMGLNELLVVVITWNHGYSPLVHPSMWVLLVCLLFCPLVCTKQQYGITVEDYQVLCAYSSIHKCELLLSVYLHACAGTSVEELILITYLWRDGFDLKGGVLRV